MAKPRTLADSVSAGSAFRFSELAANGTNTVGLKAPDALASDVTWKLPATDGSSGQALTTDGSGNLAFSTFGSAATPTTLGTVYGKSNNGSPYETALGYQALAVTSGGAANVAVGYRAGYAITSGQGNIAIGAESVYAVTTGSNNIGIGRNALQNNTASGNVGIGYNALTANTTGTTNTAVGFQALDVNTTGIANTAFGSNALGANTTANSNTAIGTSALLYNTTGANNTSLGTEALVNNTTANNNTAMGYQALYSNTTGADNAAIGYQAGYSCTTGVRNTFLGTAAGNGGFGAGAFTTGQYNISIGFTTGASSGIRNNSIVIGTPYAVVDKGENTGFISPNGGGVYQGNNSSSWSTTSDQRLKKNIVDNTEGLDKISQIRVRNFEYRTADEVTELPTHAVIKKEGVQLGVIAQELQQVCPDCVKEESTGVLSVDSDNVFWHMVNAIKELSTRLQAAEAEIATLKGA